jgi:hypothetical protein
MKYPKSVLGMPWYTSQNYDECLRLMGDREILPSEYLSWLEHVGKVADDARDAGFIVIKVFIDPQEFSAWCRARGLHTDGEARTKFADFVLAREVSADRSTFDPNERKCEIPFA